MSVDAISRLRGLATCANHTSPFADDIRELFAAYEILADRLDVLREAVRDERDACAQHRAADQAVVSHDQAHPFGQRTPWLDERRKQLVEIANHRAGEAHLATERVTELLRATR